MTAQFPASASFRPDIEGLRALAVAGVIAYHFGLTALPGGFTGVDIFFVISGYLITRHLVTEINETGRLDLWRFYARRARRLLPASLFVILATLVAGAFILSPEEQSLYSKGAMFASAYMINLWLIRWSFDYFASDAANNPFIHFWSLSVEEQFYLAWPALLVLAAWLKPGKRAVILVIGFAGLVSFAVCAWLTPVAQPWAFYFSPLRAWEFAAGGLATLAPATLWRERRGLSAMMAWLGLALIAISYLSFSEDAPFPGLLALVPVTGAVLMLLAGAAGASNGPSAVLALPPLQWGGKLSYSLYLWHWPVIVYAGMLTAELSTVQRLVCLALTLVLSAFTYHVIENPIRRNGWLMANAARALVPAVLLTGTGVAAAYANARLAVHDLDPEQRVIAESAARPSTARAKGGCVLDFETVKPKPCVFGAKDAEGSVVLFGDSHADHWSTPLIEAASKNNYRVVTYLKSSCRASRVTTWNWRLKRDYTECDRWREQSVKDIIALHPRMVVISEFSIGNVMKESPEELRHADWNEEWRAGLHWTLAAFSRAGIKVAVIRDVPYNGNYVDKCVARALWRGQAPEVCDTPRNTAANDDIAAAERDVVRSVPGATYVDLTSQFCDQTTCHVFINGKLAYRDRHHLATPFAESLEPVVEKTVLRVIGS
ncbi:acyltransferase family protein [Mesorhizobium sp.]|uniref:acyltransferase family protein n=3 Tax=Mesorhizobium sp. TaxID=1871066 RepID=UPI000FD534E1|nr:acyltransferase family protein [Mesorhizobium sp.]RVC61820.1 acyltransferase [Mesorhizobium sp. M4B.F.Ca.ET.088.02.2.1]RWF31433.1 MAG: acyltransferase [Mesorhizobium sp.]TIX12766.1 MAG: acyltransferase [Mesorhizobium sp.]TJW05999.1 MAG: acyltransferase [Mesorhizobium sp.]